jgi:hypothetical protein
MYVCDSWYVLYGLVECWRAWLEWNSDISRCTANNTLKNKLPPCVYHETLYSVFFIKIPGVMRMPSYSFVYSIEYFWRKLYTLQKEAINVSEVFVSIHRIKHGGHLPEDRHFSTKRLRYIAAIFSRPPALLHPACGLMR